MFVLLNKNTTFNLKYCEPCITKHLVQSVEANPKNVTSSMPEIIKLLSNLQVGSKIWGVIRLPWLHRTWFWHTGSKPYEPAMTNGASSGSLYHIDKHCNHLRLGLDWCFYLQLENVFQKTSCDSKTSDQTPSSVSFLSGFFKSMMYFRLFNGKKVPITPYILVVTHNCDIKEGIDDLQLVLELIKKYHMVFQKAD